MCIFYFQCFTKGLDVRNYTLYIFRALRGKNIRNSFLRVQYRDQVLRWTWSCHWAMYVLCLRDIFNL